MKRSYRGSNRTVMFWSARRVSGLISRNWRRWRTAVVAGGTGPVIVCRSWEPEAVNVQALVPSTRTSREAPAGRAGSPWTVSR